MSHRSRRCEAPAIATDLGRSDPDVRRIRLVFAALALLLLLPMALLVSRALDRVAYDREVAHETLAARVFDETERLLGDLSIRESERAFGEYEFYLDRDGGRRSPAARDSRSGTDRLCGPAVPPPESQGDGTPALGTRDRSRLS